MDVRMVRGPRSTGYHADWPLRKYKISRRIQRVEPMYVPIKGLNISMMKTLMGIESLPSQLLYIEASPSPVDGDEYLKTWRSPIKGMIRNSYTLFRKELEAEFMIPIQWILMCWNPFSSRALCRTGTQFVSLDAAHASLNISLVLKHRHESGRILALDEAHMVCISGFREVNMK
ncbi:hypothetical protein F1880_003655 [Penicillium rolfsii]|nr:hypothetical protein F1880_003655 [Penicillium rolfsii]